MAAKKFFALITCLLILAFSCTANADVVKGVKIGILTKSVTEEVFNNNASATWLWAVFHYNHGKEDNFKFYDDLNTMLLALNRGEIDEIDLPEVVGEYVTAQNSDYEISCVMNSVPVSFVFGFLKNRNSLLWYDFNKTLALMQQDGTLAELQAKYLSDFGKDKPESVKFDSFSDAPTIKIAVTGDVPPIDYIAPDGRAAGFNAAILAEIGRKMKINVELMNINTAARNTTLASERADGVFWYITDPFDKSEGILFSEPYYTFDKFVHIRKKN